MDDLLQNILQANLAFEQTSAIEYCLPQEVQRASKSNGISMVQSGHENFPSLPGVGPNCDLALSLLDKVNEGYYNEGYDMKISNIKMNSVSSRRKDELFKRYKKEQEQKIVQRRKQLQRKYSFNQSNIKESGEFTLKRGDKNQIFTIKHQDFEKLRPETDLNDTIIDNYLKIVRLAILPYDIEQKTHIFSSFFMGKLLGDQLRDDVPPEKQTEQMIQKIQKRITDSYNSVKRWTRKIDIFTKDYLVIPINAYKHWDCIIIVYPNSLLTEPSLCKILYLDSMLEKKIIFSEAIKRYLELQLEERKKQTVSLQKVQTYQLMVPRQTNTHDCGLYTLCYIEYFLVNHQILDLNMEKIENRYQLKIFPRSIIFTMRECLRRLFMGLLIEEDKEKVINSYIKLRKEIEQDSIQLDFDQINEREFKKYFRINSHLLQDKKKKQAELEYQCKIKFYLDCEINHYQKDTPL